MSAVVLAGRGLRRAYPQPDQPPLEVLRGVDIELRAGEMAAILGPSGSGKSTLLHVLGLMDRPTGGALEVFGRSVLEAGEDERARLRGEKLAFVFQFDSMLPEFTLLENVAFPGRIRGEDPASCGARARELLEQFGLARLADRFPRQVSGGERQRAAIARALHGRPGVVFADEPTGNLDRENGEVVFSDLRRLAGEFGTTVVVVTHNEQAAAICDRTYRLREGLLTLDQK